MEFFNRSHSNREYELITEAHAQLSVVGNCSRFSLSVCSRVGKQLAGGGWSAIAGGEGGGTDSTLQTGIEHLEQFRTTES
jgi:hypothetical protein